MDLAKVDKERAIQRESEKEKYILDRERTRDSLEEQQPVIKKAMDLTQVDIQRERCRER